MLLAEFSPDIAIFQLAACKAEGSMTMSLNRAKRMKDLLVLFLAAVFILGATPSFAAAHAEAATSASAPLFFHRSGSPRNNRCRLRRLSYSSMVDYVLWGYSGEKVRQDELARAFTCITRRLSPFVYAFSHSGRRKARGLLMGGHDVVYEAAGM